MVKTDEILEEHYRELIVASARSYVGYGLFSSQRNQIIEDYNQLCATDYYMKNNDAWGAAFVSLVMKQSQIEHFPFTCNCLKMLHSMRESGKYHNPHILKYQPQKGDIIFLSLVNDFCSAIPDNVVIIEKVTGGEITVIWGNYNGRVEKKHLPIDSPFILGFGSPV